MTYSDIPAGARVFLDANAFISYFCADPIYGAGCARLLERIELQEIEGATSTHVLAEVYHRLMTIEACEVLGWPAKGVGHRLRQHPEEIKKLTGYRRALDGIQLFPIQVLSVNASHCYRLPTFRGVSASCATMPSQSP